MLDIHVHHYFHRGQPDAVAAGLAELRQSVLNLTETIAMNDAAAIAIVQEVLATAKTNTDTLAKVFVEVTALKTTNGTLTEAIAALEQQIADMDNVPAALAESLTELKEVVGAQTTSLTALDQLNPDTPPAEGNPG